MKELTEQLVGFKQVTIELIRALQQDKIDKLDGLLDNRQSFIENMEKLQYTTEEFASICDELDILKVQHELLELMQAKREDTKEELNKIQLTRNANNNYNKSFYINSSMFNKKI
ncbi:flagellar protein FliT [Clostridium estertheticum]|uniref:flagellar protein FliT n=1 Tax=Clostridium estertheticum TaxID=238834 RepID=UPI001C0BB291|nr:flagellar protein FliT [Clostridium estertheticum]MBU3176441.1 flagellar protein FliT [Clostridium estertheticum]